MINGQTLDEWYADIQDWLRAAEHVDEATDRADKSPNLVELVTPFVERVGVLITALRESREREERFRDALVSIATLRQETDDFQHPNYDWKLLASKLEDIARRALSPKEPTP